MVLPSAGAVGDCFSLTGGSTVLFAKSSARRTGGPQVVVTSEGRDGDGVRVIEYLRSPMLDRNR